MLRTSHFTVFVACLAFAFVGCSGQGGENTGQSRGAVSQNDNGQGNGNNQGEDQDNDEDDEQNATVQLISFDTSTDTLTGTNLITLQTNQYNLVFGSTQLFNANLSQYPQGPLKNAAAAYDTGLANHNQSQISSALQTYASLGGKANITFVQNGLTRTLTSIRPFN